MKSKLLYITIINLLFITQACKRSETDCGDLSDVITNYNISDADKAKIPYTGTDTLVFISDANDTATLIGQGKNIHIETLRNSLKGGDCPRTKVDKNETIDIIYSGNNKDLYNIKYGLDGNSEKTQLVCTINNISHGDYPYYLNNEAFYIDTVRLNNKLYYGTTINIKNVIYGLYNWQYGFTKISIEGGKNWYLKL